MRKRFHPNSKYVKYRDGTWIECRKRIYLYWFKFLRHAEESSEHKVQWNKYRAWGGKNIVMNTKFDIWWEEHWKDCFGIDEKTQRSKFFIGKNPKADGIRYALLVYENLHRGSTLDIAIVINRKESRGRGMFTNLAEATEDLKESIGKKGKYGISKKRRRDATEWNTGHRIEEVDNTVMNFDHIISKSSTGKFHTDNQDTIKKLQAMVRRYKNQAMKHLDNVSHGKF